MRTSTDTEDYGEGCLSGDMRIDSIEARSSIRIGSGTGNMAAIFWQMV